jgi:hypothetical protein
MALANGSAGYVPPAPIRKFREDNWTLPKIWAGENDVVWDGKESLCDYDITEVYPWGWSRAIVHELLKAGVRREAMPSDEWICNIKNLSSREFAARIQQELKLNVAVCQTWEQVELFVRKHGRSVMKTLWSSSGKGLMMTDANNARAWMENAVARDGAVVCELWMDKELDFALEFYIYKDGTPVYEGLSIFNTAATGRFLGQDCRSESKRKQLLLTKVEEEELNTLIEWWRSRLMSSDIRAFGYYGPMGIDMLVDSAGRINPCVEINWRMTMGHVSIWCDKTQKNADILNFF